VFDPDVALNGDPAAAPSRACEVRTLLQRPTALPRRTERFRLKAPAARERLNEVWRALHDPAQGAAPTSRGVEWLLDNYHLVLRVLEQLETEFDDGFAHRLPRLTDDPHRAPRVLALAELLYASGDRFVDLSRAEATLRSAQAQGPALTLAELWALPLLLRHVTVASLVHGAESLPLAGGSEVRDAIQSLRALDQADWLQFAERTSVVEQVLRDKDPTAVYAQTQFSTRNRCRTAVEEIAARCGRTEVDVAFAAIALARTGETMRTRHVGFALIGDGRAALERALNVVPPTRGRVVRCMRERPTGFYLGGIGALTVAGLVAVASVLTLGSVSLAWTAVLIVASVLPVSSVAVGIANWLVARMVPPAVLPKMDFSEGIPDTARTVVVVPALLTSPDDVEPLVQQLELHYLSGPDAALDFALLSDFGDAATEVLASDEAILQRAIAGLATLNARYAAHGHAPFHLMHRARRYNASMACWMGWERKRGKLVEFNRLLLGDDDPTWTVVGDRDRLYGARFVITLDADTRLPHAGAQRLIETLAHPLNVAAFDALGNVRAGYTVLQPRVEIAPWSGDASMFARVFSGARGLDPYTRAVSDVYQDLFGEGLFVGKGIYDVVAFERCTRDRVPEDSILSHDLFEGLLGRAGFVSDVTVIEAFPSTYIEYAKRRHRWVRGDWQLLPWLARRVPMANGLRSPNRLLLLARWKLVDNLRRSLSPVALIAVLVGAWWALPPRLQPLTYLLAMLPLFAAIPNAAAAAIRRMERYSTRRDQGAFDSGGNRAYTIARWLLDLAFLPNEAALVVDAIVRTATRLAITRARMMEWTTAAATARMLERNSTLSLYARHLWQPPILATVVAVLLWWGHPTALPFAAPILLLWLVAPRIAHRISRSSVAPIPPPSASEVTRLRLLARRTWHFYDRFVGPQDHWLPPDHFQETPLGAIAHRTSPTNIGMYLLAIVSAWRLGYLSTRVMAARLRHSLDAIAALPSYRGHLFNWYATDTLDVLQPRYVSTVDSGNLAAALIVVRQLCRSVHRGEAQGGDLWLGLLDAVAVLADSVRRCAAGPQATDAKDHVAGALAALRTRIEERVGDPLVLEPPVTAAMDHLHRTLLDLARCGAVAAADVHALQDAELMVANQLRTLRKSLPNGDDEESDEATCTAELEWVEDRADALVERMNFGFLYDPARRLLRIGHDVGEDRPDANHYDLLASEARVASLIAIAQGHVPRAHWLRLGRPLTSIDGRLTLLSWSGTMFEFLLPPLLVRERDSTLLGQSCRVAVAEQIRFGDQHQVPWGVSESGYHRFDAAHAYQYRAFGVPALGLRRSAPGDLVVAPYASVMALSFAPSEVLRNLDHLDELGGMGHYGLYEAIDFTLDRLGPDQRHAVVRSYMAHHQGMILVAIVNRVLDAPFVSDFHRDPAIQSVEMLLEERPSGTERAPSTGEPVRRSPHQRRRPAPAYWEAEPDGALPDVHLLSNRRLTSLLTAGGGGYLTWQGTRLTRWSGDRTLEPPGVLLLIGDHDTGLVWPVVPDVGDTVRFDAGSAEWRITHPISARLRVCVSADDDVEIRHIRLRGTPGTTRRLRLMLVSDVTLSADLFDRHPAFNNLFVETEFREGLDLLTAHRRTRSETTGPTVGWWATGSDSGCTFAGFETARESFIGRNGNRIAPAGAWALRAVAATGPESPIDPVAVIAVDVMLEPHRVTDVAFMTGVAANADALIEVVQRHQSIHRVTSTVTSSRDHANEALARHGGSVPQLAQSMRLLAAVLFAPTELCAPREVRDRNLGAQATLWSHAISGDLPIVVVGLRAVEDSAMLGQVLAAQRLWRERGMRVDVVVLNQRSASYEASLDDEIARLIERWGVSSQLGVPGGIVLLNERRLSDDDHDALLGAAQVVLDASAGQLADALARLRTTSPALPVLTATRTPGPLAAPRVGPFEDGRLGDFSDDGREFVIFLPPGATTPAPWSNVIANEQGGCLVTEVGGGYTWSLNAGENRLTPWTNDPVSDLSGEALYLRDEETAEVWTPTPQPTPSGAAYEVRHGAGFTEFRTTSHGVEQHLRIGMAPEASTRIMRLRLTNRSDRPRRFTVTSYAELVLGVDAQQSRPRVTPSFDVESEVMLFRSPWSSVFGTRVAFSAVSRSLHGLTTDRTEFLGRRGDRSAPAALRRVGLSSTVAGDRDVCSALQVHVNLAADGVEEVVFVLGQAASAAEAIEAAKTLRNVERASTALAVSEAGWDRVLNRVQVQTPDPVINRLANRWLLYQSISSRLLGRTGFYQSSGAYGFRDQLQDVMALSIVAPERYRAHVLEAARHQFEEGDVLHWWHPPSDAGIRTRCSDDLVWLPFAVAHYVATTGDVAILSEPVRYLHAPPLREDEVDRYAVFEPSHELADLYQHCICALDRAAPLGVHGLPLIGSGDWNDGMDRVGHEGRGESVWLAWFIAATLLRVAPLCEQRGDIERAEAYRERAKRLAAAVEAHGWDGAWYRRGWYDDGGTLGSSSNAACQIDALSQSWAILSGLGDGARSSAAIRSVQERLVREADGLVLLLTPPFRETEPNPGYIRAYPPGVRENGGQYTHATIWTLWAIAQEGDPDTAVRLFGATSPVQHGRDPAYRTEPYAVAADIYSTAPHTGRGGWTWYTGAAAWSYRFLLEGVLGIQLRDGALVVEPNLPTHWPGYTATVALDGRTWQITVDAGRVELVEGPQHTAPVPHD
jgi:cyclic beta-1,2-glucan synthetase